MSRDILIFTNLIKQTLWFNADQYRNAVIIIQHLLKARNEERHLPNRTETNAAELNRRPGCRPRTESLKNIRKST